MSVTTDATSGIAIPQSATEWGDSSLSPYWAVPDHLWLCQELLGNLADSIGTMTLTKVGLPTYANIVTGWSTKAIHIELNISGSCGFTNTGTGIDVLNASALWLMYIRVTGAPAGLTNVVSLGGTASGTNNDLVTSLTTSPKFEVRVVAGATTDGTQNPNGAGVIPLLLQWDKTNQVFRAFTTQERIDSVFVPSSSFTGTGTKGIGTLSSNANSGPFDVLYMAAWKGVGAEMSDYNIRAGFNALGWSATTSFVVTYTASLVSTGLAIDDRIDEGATYKPSVSESASLAAESEASVATDAPMLSETLATVEAVAVVLQAVQGLAEETDTSEALVSIYAVAAPVNESMTTLANTGGIATYVANVGAPDSISITDSVGETITLSLGLADNVVTNELVDAIATITQAPDEVTIGGHMGYVETGDTLRFIIAVTDRTGQAVDADSTPSVVVLKQGTALGYAPTVTRKTVGTYEAALVCTTGNGFDLDKEYSTYTTTVLTGLTIHKAGPSFSIATYTTDDVMSRLGALMKRNSVLDGGSGNATVVRNGDGVMTSARLRIFADGTDLSTVTRGAADNADNELYRYRFGATEDVTGRMGNAFMHMELEPA